MTVGSCAADKKPLRLFLLHGFIWLLGNKKYTLNRGRSTPLPDTQRGIEPVSE